MLVSPDVPLQLGLDSRQQFCLQSLPSMERLPLQYTVCVAHSVKAAHQEAVQQLSEHSRELPNMKALRLVQFRFRLDEMKTSLRFISGCRNCGALAWLVSPLARRKVCLTSPVWLLCVCARRRLPFWKLLANMDSGTKVEREMRIFSNRLKRHQLGEGVISLNEHSTTLLSDMVHDADTH